MCQTDAAQSKLNTRQCIPTSVTCFAGANIANSYQRLAVMKESLKLTEDKVASLRALAHDLSNSLETILQASYLLSQAKLDEESRKWLQMIEAASHKAVTVNRKIREKLRTGPG